MYQASPESGSEAVGPIIGDTLFRAFPTELLIAFFLQSCGIYCPIDKITEETMLLLQVCQAWKELTLQTPQLWASFALDFPSTLPGPDKSEFLVSEMKGWLERSPTIPLSFKFYYPASDATCTNFIRCLLASSARWRNVSLCAPRPDMPLLQCPILRLHLRLWLPLLCPHPCPTSPLSRPRARRPKGG
jgi:hypothetical protein